jgi:hypothetical protein
MKSYLINVLPPLVRISYAMNTVNRCDLMYTPFNKVYSITEGEYSYFIDYYPNNNMDSEFE